MNATMPWGVEVLERGRSGSVVYREAENVISFYWEFGGGDTVAIIWAEQSASWNARYPWAAARRSTILERVARELIRQKAPACRAEIDHRDGFIYLLQDAV